MSVTGTKQEIISRLLTSPDVLWVSVTTVDPTTLKKSHEFFIPSELSPPAKQQQCQRSPSPFDHYMAMMTTPTTSQIPPIYVNPGDLPKLAKRRAAKTCREEISHGDDLTYFDGVWPESAPDIVRYQKMMARIRAYN